MCGGRIRETNMFIKPFIAVACASACSFVFADDNHQADIEIVVDAKGNVSLNQPTSLVKSVTADEIKSSGISSINDVFTDLFLLPISGDSNGNGVLGFPDLGGYGEASKSNTLILLNGRPLNNPTLEAPNLSFIPLNSIAGIDLYQGGASTLFGSGATGGVINIITTQSALTFDNQVYAQTGSFGYGKTGANMATQLSDSLTLSANADFVTKDGYRHHTDYTNSAGSIAISSQQLNHQWDLSYANSFQRRKDSGAVTLSAARDDRKTSGAKSTIDHRSEIFSLNRATLTSAGQHNVHLGHRESLQETIYPPYPSSGEQTTNVSNVDYTFVSDQGKSLFGSSIQHAAYKGIHYQDRIDVFFRKEIPARDIASFITGLRLGHVDDRIDASTQKEQIVWGGELVYLTQTEFGNIGMRIDRAFRYATLDENNPNNFNLISDILKPQLGDTVSTTLETEDLSARIYYTQLENELVYDTTATANVNLDQTSRYGIDGNMNLFHSDNLTINGTLRWIQTKIESGTFDGKEVPGVPNLTGGLKIESKLSEHQTLNLSTLYVANSYPWSDFDNSLGKTNAHTTTTASWSYAKERLRGILKINNLFDQTYNAYEIDAYSGHSITPAEPLNFEIGVAYEF